jgi:hypothetical protein
MGGMPNTRELRLGAPWALATVAAMLLLTACGLDGPDPGVEALVPSTTASGQPAGPDAEMAPEASAGEVAPPVADDSVSPPHLRQASLPPREALPRLPDSVAVVGDSLTESAAEQITAYFSGLGVDVVTIDGAQNRRMAHGERPDPGTDIVERIAAVAEPELWVIALGTNDVGAEVTSERFGADVDTVLAAIPSGAPVVWVDVWIDDRRSQVQSANSVLREKLATREFSIVADWFAHGDDPGIIAGDGVHLTEDGRYMFAATIAAATVDLFEQV